jgi:hypothetical protein
MELLIGFGYRMRNGKDTAITAIKEKFGCHVDIARYGFGDLVRQEVPNQPFGKPTERLKPEEYRRALQGHGLWRRRQDERYWIRKMESLIHSDNPEVALVSGLRMQNELGWLRGQKGIYVRVTRLGYKPESDAVAADSTENDLNGVEPDYDLEAADGNLMGLKAQAAQLFREISAKHAPALTKRLSKA